MSQRNKIILIGFMGTGKSSIAAHLSELIKFAPLDVDQEIVSYADRTIPEIFAQDGEEAFREIETKVLEQIVISSEPAVIATGGGAVLKPYNRQLMLEYGFVVCLTAGAEVIIDRVSNDQNRPLLRGDVAERVHTLLQARAGAYDFAHHTIDTSDLTISQIVNEIVEAWQNANFER